MKRQSNPSIKAHLVRGALCLLLVAAVCLIPLAMAQRNATRRSLIAQPATGSQKQPQNVPVGEICRYAVTTSKGTIVPGTTDTGNHCDDCTTPIALPFPVTFYDQTFNSANVSSNGNLQFTSDNGTFISFCLPVDFVDNLIAPYWSDLYTADQASGQGIFTSVSGAAPNRIFNIEFREEFCCSGGPPILYFEIRLHEDTPDFEMIYGNLSGTTGDSATVGVQRDTGSSFTNYSCESGLLAEGLQLNYTLECVPTPPAVPCGTYVTTTSTDNIVPGVTDTGNHCDDCTTPVLFPFPISLYGQFFFGATVSSNGNLQFIGNNGGLGGFCPLPDFDLDEAVIPYQGDLVTSDSSDCSVFSSGCGVFTSVTGTEPNRVFNIEWRTAYFDKPGTANFEVQFSESDPSFFNIIYGSTANNGLNEESGVQRSVDGPATTFSCYEPILTPGLKVTYTCARAPRATPTPRPRPTPARRPLPPPPAGLSMYGGNGNGGSHSGALIFIDQSNGNGTVIGTPVAGVGLSGIAFHPDGRLFASTIAGGGSTSTLIQINPDTGSLVSTIGSITDNGTPISIGDLSFQPGTALLYGIRSNADNQGSGGKLYTINIGTGVATLRGDTGTGAGGGLGFAPNGTLYQLAFGSLNVISPVDGHVISSVANDSYFDGLGIRSDGILFASPGGGGALYTINPATGEAAFFGDTGQGSVSDIDFRQKLVSRKQRLPMPRRTSAPARSRPVGFGQNAPSR